MEVSPNAGKLAEASMLVNVPKLVTAYFAEVPDPSAPEQRIMFGTSGHRGRFFWKPLKYCGNSNKQVSKTWFIRRFDKLMKVII
jgi:hypothetical protein